MAVSSYEKDGKVLWQVYVDVRGRHNPRVRFQKRITSFTTEREAQTMERQLIRDLAEKTLKEASRGLTWEETIERWLRFQELYPTKRLSRTTLIDYVALLRNWTKPWYKCFASELNRGDGREIFKTAEIVVKSASFRKHLKTIINQVYEWAIEERLISGVQHSPVYGLELEPDREEKLPEILTVEEIRNLLGKSKKIKNHSTKDVMDSFAFGKAGTLAYG